MNTGHDLLIKWETEGLDTHDEAITLAAWLIETGQSNSAERYRHFVADVIPELS